MNNNELQKELQLRRENELNDIRQIAQTNQGKRFFTRLLAEGRVLSSTFTGNSTGFFLEGHRNLALKFFSELLEACPKEAGEIIVQTKGVQDVSDTRTK